MLDFRLEKWSAVAPGLTSEKDWSDWLNSRLYSADEDNIKTGLKKISPMLRRRFTKMGKVAAAALCGLELDENTPLVFASRHGDVDLTLSLLQNIASDQDLSPTGFSLAVHNAIAGLLSIAQKDTSSITSVAACQNMLPTALLEAAIQLQDFSKVVCLICDTPVPKIYQPYTESSDIPYAIALLLSRDVGTALKLSKNDSSAAILDETAPDYMQLLTLLLTNQSEVIFAEKNTSTHWKLQSI
ncbi:beta-ketoacyl synthase chain length factor [Marinomonas ostreistagni]|uniref:Beta-ketoacyl synthase chain length factor n=1 Tax=Marinomonas ostreistagni TaxID=359209 RepID=A0ABS0ZA84_9GAMM|nr:beta-ketoacyl synthase chain length factor [Marinomonas ostreistagni]MBJ7550338.1 beta-ketoacyl synthase chain length factor [Marinomonas ostreistagni]